MTLTWVESAGGPLVAMAYEHRGMWSGSAPSHGGGSAALLAPVDEELPATDYDSACAAAPLGLVHRQGFSALALERGPKAWRELSDGGVIVCWGYANSREIVDELVEKLVDVRWKSTPMALELGGGQLLVFDASLPGRLPRDWDHQTYPGTRAHYAKGELKAKYRLAPKVAPGTYQILTATLEPDDDTFVELVRLRAR